MDGFDRTRSLAARRALDHPAPRSGAIGRQDQLDRLPDRLLRRPAEQAFGGGVPGKDGAVESADQDRVVARFDDRRQLRMLTLGALALGDIQKHEQQPVDGRLCVAQWMQGPVPVAHAPFWMVGKLKRLGVGRERLAACRYLPKNGLDFFARIQLEVVPAREKPGRMTACIGIGLVHAHEIEVPVQINHAEMRGREDAIEQFVALPQRPFRLDPLCCIAQDHGQQALLRPFQLRNRGIDWNFPAVGSQSDDLAETPHAALADFGARKVADMRVVRVAEALGNQQRDRLAQQFRFAVTEHLLGRRIGERDFMALVDGDDGFYRCRDDAGQALLAALCLGDVVRHGTRIGSAQFRLLQVYAGPFSIRQRGRGRQTRVVGGKFQVTGECLMLINMIYFIHVVKCGSAGRLFFWRFDELM